MFFQTFLVVVWRHNCYSGDEAVSEEECQSDGDEHKSDSGTSVGGALYSIQRAKMCPLGDKCTWETQQGSSSISTDEMVQTDGNTPQASRSPLSQNVHDTDHTSSDPIFTLSALTASTDVLLAVPAKSTSNLVGSSGKKSSLLLQDAQVSSFGQKWKIRNMAEVSVCMCMHGDLAASMASNILSKVVCCQITGCETK